MNEAAIELEDVQKTYRLYPSPVAMALDVFGVHRLVPRVQRPQFREFDALRGITLSVGHGERWGVVGRNGAGKTTLLKLLTTNYAPTSGRVVVRGSVQALFATDDTLHRELSGMDNIRAALMYNGLWGRRLERAAEDVVEFVELGEALERPVRTYSQGMRARLEFATATAIEPDILIIDEVLSAGDGYFAIKSAERVRALAESGCTLLLVSHQLEHVRAFCTKAVWIDRGRVVTTGSAEEVLAAYEQSFDGEPESAREAPGDQAGELARGRSERTRHHSFELPEAFASRFLVAKIRETEPVEEGETPGTATLRGGATVERFGDAPGFEISDLDLRSDGERIGHLHTGDPLMVSIAVRVPAGSHALRCAILVHSTDGELVAAATSPADRFTVGGTTVREWSAELPALPLGYGDYALSAGVFDAGRGDDISVATRIVYLSRAMALRVAPTNDADPPILHWPGVWHCGDSAPAPGRVSGVV
jgi:lipopolysaccharide transport system ATP-binding protein